MLTSIFKPLLSPIHGGDTGGSTGGDNELQPDTQLEETTEMGDFT